MRRAFLILITVSFVQTTEAQINSVPQLFSAGQAAPKKLTTEQSAELDEATRLSAKVVELYKEQKYDEALPPAKRVIEIRERILGDYDGRTAAALINLAELYLAKGEYGVAERIYEKLMPVYEKVFGVDNLSNTAIIESLALVNYLRGNFKQAEMFYSRSLTIKEKALGAEHVDVGQAVYRLAEFYRSRGEYKKAEPLFLRAIAIQDKNPASKDSQGINIIERYVCFLYESKGLEEAERVEKRFRKARNPDGQDKISGDVLNGRALRLPTPGYPPEASRLRAGGVVRVQVRIDESGKVIDAKVVCGHPVLAKASLAAAWAARFTPTKLSGKPVKVSGIIIYNFVVR